MIFNSVTYLLFLPLIVALYWSLPQRGRVWMLLVASLTFYGLWRVDFLPVLLASAVVDYFVALHLPRTDLPRRRKLLVALSLLVNLGLLCYFKYLIFFTNNAFEALRLLGVQAANPAWSIILPLGISFYTFQTISYTIDVYRKNIEPERSFITYACYVTFFPQLIAGPILRAAEVIPQLLKRLPFDPDLFVFGLRRVLFGLFLKTVLADNVGVWVDVGFAQNLSGMSALDVWTLAFLFGFQIYFDFSAYSHIAIGSAAMMGLRFPENFNFPYLSSSPREFWKRWHISLSSWIRDYLYLPLVGAVFGRSSTGGLETTGREAKRRNQALFLSWLIMGLWHGANWTFVLWGLYHALLVMGHRIVSPWTKSLPRLVRSVGGWCITLPLIMLGWIFFRARTASEALMLLAKVFNPAQYRQLGMRENAYLTAALAMVAIVAAFLIHERMKTWFERHAVTRLVVETGLFTVLIAFVFVFLRPINQFIYFQF
jgi:alginate O-acetyltransferase complex protein AlgI